MSGEPDSSAVQPIFGPGAIDSTSLSKRCDYNYDCVTLTAANGDITSDSEKVATAELSCCAAFWVAESDVNYNDLAEISEKWCVTREWMYGKVLYERDTGTFSTDHAEFDSDGVYIETEEEECEEDDEDCTDGYDEYYIGLGYTENGNDLFSWACIEDLIANPYDIGEEEESDEESDSS